MHTGLFDISKSGDVQSHLKIANAFQFYFTRLNKAEREKRQVLRKLNSFVPLNHDLSKS